MNHNKNVFDWIDSGEFQSDVEEALTEVLRAAKNADNERQTANAFETALYYLIRSKTGVKVDFKSETAIDNIVHRFGPLSDRKSGHGRLDAVINNLVIEYKHFKKLNSEEQYKLACNQVCDYLVALKEKTDIKCSAILTDGLRISYFNFSNDAVVYTALSNLEKSDIATIVKAIVANETKKFVPKNIINDFGISPLVSSETKSLASEFYNILKHKATDKTNMLYQEWLSLLHLSVDDNGKGNDIEKRQRDLSRIFNDNINNVELEYKALYALQTTYAIIVKLIACKVVDKLDYNANARTFYDLSNITSKEMQEFFEKVEDGYSYRNSNVSNFLEGDFFSWYSDKGQWTNKIYSNICKIVKLINEYSSFSFNIVYEPVDVFKDLYMGIIPKSVRHSMGEYFTPGWLADCVISEGLSKISNPDWKAIDPCCGSGIFVIALIKKIVGNIDINHLTETQRIEIKKTITSRVYGIDINPLSVLSARVGYYLALQPFGSLRDIEIPIYLGDSAIIPSKEIIDGIECYKYSVVNEKLPFDVILPVSFVKNKDFGKIMSQFQTCVKTNDESILSNMILCKLSKDEQNSKPLKDAILDLSKKLIYLHKNNWDGIWVRISTNFMLIARLDEFDLITGNPPWVKWEHLPAVYASKIKTLCNVKHIFSNDGGQFGGTQLNICALISNVAATNWLKCDGILAFLMPDSIMSQNSYEEYRNFYLDYDKKTRLYLQGIDKWEAPLRPFRYDDKAVTQDFNTYYYSSKQVDYNKGIPVRIITRSKDTKDDYLNTLSSFEKVKPLLSISQSKAIQLANGSTAFSYVSEEYDFSLIIGKTDYQYRTGVEFTPQELYMLVGVGESNQKGYYRFSNKKFNRSKYIIDDMPVDGWELPVDYIYPIITATHLRAFQYDYCNEYCVLPYEKSNIKSPISYDKMQSEQCDLFSYLVSHEELINKQSEKSKQMHRGKEFYSLSKIGKYTFAPYIVAARDNTTFCAAVVRPRQTEWDDIKQSICVKHTIIISQDSNDKFINENEAYYLSGILNSNIVIHYIHNSFKKNGFSLNKSNLYIPKFDTANKIHNEISTLAKAAEKRKDTSDIQSNLSKLYLELCKAKK